MTAKQVRIPQIIGEKNIHFHNFFKKGINFPSKSIETYSEVAKTEFGGMIDSTIFLYHFLSYYFSN